MKKIIGILAISASISLLAVGQEPAIPKAVGNEHNTSVSETNSTNTSMPIAAPAIQFEGC